MSHSQSNPSWYALRVMARHEKNVDSCLKHKGIEGFLPLYMARHKWSDRYKDVQLPLFPGYVFSRFNISGYSAVVSTPGVIEVVRFGRQFVPIDNEEIEDLQHLMDSGVGAIPWPRLEVGDTVEITDGPLVGLRGAVIELKKTPRLVLSVTLLQRSVLVELERDWIEKVPSALHPCQLPPADVRPRPNIQGFSN